MSTKEVSVEERHLSLSEAATALDISERTAYRWIKSGKLRAYKPGRDYWIPETAIREVVEASKVAPKASELPSLFDNLVEERRPEEASPIADDKRWLALQQRRGTLTRLEIAGVSVNPEDLPDETAAFLAQDLRLLLQTADIRLGDRIESTIRILLDSGEELVMGAWSKVA
jgi:excisionase family DNA binding protein